MRDPDPVIDAYARLCAERDAAVELARRTHESVRDLNRFARSLRADSAIAKAGVR